MLLYNSFPKKKLICNTLKALNIPIGNLYVDLKFVGLFNVNSNNYSFKIYHNNTKIENEIYWKGIGNTWESDTLWIWEKLSAKANVIFDIGANTGVYSLISAAINKNAGIIAFEPGKLNYEKLVENIEVNSFKNIKCEQKAISSENGILEFLDVKDTISYSATLSHEKLKDMPEDNLIRYMVDVVSLDSYINENKIPEVNLVKIDVELHEISVIKGFMNSIAKYRPIIVIEILTDEIGLHIDALLKPLNYIFYRLTDKNKMEKIDNLKSGKVYHWNFLLVPDDKEILLK